jgi:DNA polymerase
MSEYDTLVRQIHDCTLCTLSRKRNKAVPGEGSLTTDIVFIGEGPGFHEDQQGRPFVGPAGRLLEELLASISLTRADVYITNMIKCRAPNNRDPLPGEIEACKPYLDEQIEMIDPKVIVTLGRYSFSKFFSDVPIGKARGKARRWNGRIIYPVYHPAAALRNGSLRSALESDFAGLPALLKNANIETGDSHEDKTEQLSFF